MGLTLSGRRYLLTSVFFFLLLAAAGVYLRAQYVFPFPGLDFKNMIHAHSHVAYFGWASLAMMGATYYILPALTKRPLEAGRLANLQLYAIVVMTLGAFISFGAGGYNPVSIVFSALNGFLWYSHAYIFYKNYLLIPHPRPFSAKALAVSVIYLLVAFAGTWLITALTVMGVKNELLKNVGVYLFLHNFVDGWLFTGLFGLAAYAIPDLDRRLGTAQVGGRLILALALLTLPGFLMWLQPYGLNAVLVWLGGITRVAILIPYSVFIYTAWTAYFNGTGVVEPPVAPLVRGQGGVVSLFFGMALAFFVARLVMQLATAVWPPLMELGQQRQLFVGYLHNELLGAATSIFIGLIYSWVTGQNEKGSAGKLKAFHFWVHCVGTAGMVGSLFVAGSALVFQLPLKPAPFISSAFWFSILLLLGAIIFAVSLMSEGRD